MDRRLVILIAFAAVLAVTVIAVVIGRGGGSSDSLTKPEVDVPDGPPPKQLVVKDLEPGEGPGAQTGDQLSLQYVGVIYETGHELGSSWETGQPFQFRLGAGNIIPGWDQGLQGMKAGGRRELIIPPALGYGAQGQPPDIPPNSTLVFVMDLLSIT